MLSGFEPWSSALLPPKLDSLFMNLATSSRAITVLLFARCVVFIGLLSAVFVLRYGAPFVLSVALASCALVGLNLLGWFYFWPDYLGSGVFGWGYSLFPILLIPMAVERRVKRLGVLASFAFATGLLYGMISNFVIAVFGSFAAVVWLVVEIGSVRGLAVAAASAVGVLLAISYELVRFVKIGVEGTRSTFALLLDWTQTAQILIHRGGYTAIVALVLAVLSGAIAVTYRGERMALVRLAAVYIVVMMLDPVMKAAGRSLEPVVPVFVLSTSYYSYVFAPVVFAASLCIGFRHLRPIKLGLLSMLLLLIAAKMTWDSAKELAATEIMSLSIIREVADELKRDAAEPARAVVIRETAAELEAFKPRLQQPLPNNFAAFGLNMADGYLPNPNNAYAIFMSNVATPGKEPVATSIFERHVGLYVPITSHFTQAANGCLEQRSAVPIDAYLALPILQNASVRYAISMFELESRYLRLKMAGAPVFCTHGRDAARPFVYEFVQPVPRFGLAREITVVDDLREAYRALRADPQFANGDKVVLTKAEAAKLTGAVAGLAEGSGMVKVLADDGDQVRFAVSSPTDTLLIVRDAYSQPVSATSEKGKLDVIGINGAFIGIRVPRGDSRVTMTYG